MVSPNAPRLARYIAILVLTGALFVGTLANADTRIALSIYTSGFNPDSQEIFVLDDGRLERITDNLVRDQHPAWANNGRYVIFERWHEPRPPIVVYDTRSNRLHENFFSAIEGSDPAWSDTANELAYQYGDRVGNRWMLEIRTASLDGTHQRRIEVNPDWSKVELAWAPDASRIAFVEPVYADLWIVDVETGDARDIVRNAWQPSWSPNGDRIVFTRAGDLHIVTVETGETRQLAEHISQVSRVSPVWTRDGWIVHSRRSLNGSELWRIRPDGSGDELLYDDLPGTVSSFDVDQTGLAVAPGDSALTTWGRIKSDSGGVR